MTKAIPIIAAATAIGITAGGLPSAEAAPGRHSIPAGYTIGGTVSIIINWGPANCIQLNWPTTAQAVCNPGHVWVAHQYNVRPGQLIGVDPVISGNHYASCTLVDEYTGRIITHDSGSLGDGYDINCLLNTN